MLVGGEQGCGVGGGYGEGEGGVVEGCTSIASGEVGEGFEVEGVGGWILEGVGLGGEGVGFGYIGV